jgi:hypothetical protein
MDQPPMTMPEYVEYGGRVDSPAPFLSQGGRLRALVLDADADRLDGLVHRALTVPAAGAAEYRAVGGIVLLQVGRFDSISCTRAPYDTWGSVREGIGCFWVPVVAGRERLGVFVADRFGFFAPYVFVDNPYSLIGGRDVYGYNKSEARFEPADGSGEHVVIRTFGGDFQGGRAEWHPIVELEQGEPDGSAGPALEGVADLAKVLVPGLLDLFTGEGDIQLPGLTLAEHLMKSALAGRGNQVFLKQFRDTADGARACYQVVVEAGATFHAVSARPVGAPVTVTIHPWDSHPITAELGVDSQVASQALDVELDFTVEPGEVIGGYR